MQGALSDLRVVEWGELISAPSCTKLFADLGAEVVKVEPPLRGDESRQRGPFPGDVPHQEKSGLFLYMNTSKLGITLDVARPRGRDALDSLLLDADLFVTNKPVPVLDGELGGLQRLRKVNPRLIITAITPYGLTGPYRNWKGCDLTCGALGGMAKASGYPDREPLTTPVSQGDQQAGLMAAIATLIALADRDMTGRGCIIDLSVADCWASFHIGIGVLAYLSEGRVKMRSGNRALHRPFPDDVVPCKDGFVCIDAPQNRQWHRLVDLMGRPEWTKDPIFANRLKAGDEYASKAQALLTRWTSQLTKEEIFTRCQQNKVPAAPIKTISDVVQEDQLRHREYFQTVDHPATGPLLYPGHGYRFSKTPAELRPAPLLGQHNEEILCGRLRYTKEQLAGLRAAGVI